MFLKREKDAIQSFRSHKFFLFTRKEKPDSEIEEEIVIQNVVSIINKEV